MSRCAVVLAKDTRLASAPALFVLIVFSCDAKLRTENAQVVKVTVNLPAVTQVLRHRQVKALLGRECQGSSVPDNQIAGDMTAAPGKGVTNEQHRLSHWLRTSQPRYLGKPIHRRHWQEASLAPSILRWLFLDACRSNRHTPHRLVASSVVPMREGQFVCNVCR